MRYQSTVRCFNATCRKCGRSILFWEGSAGSKVIFDYPVVGKLIKHICRPNTEKRKKNFVKSSYSEHTIFDLERPTYHCPVCGKLFKDKKSITNHIKIMEKSDSSHEDFFKNALNLIENTKSLKKTIYSGLDTEDYLDNKYGVIIKKKHNKT